MKIHVIITTILSLSLSFSLPPFCEFLGEFRWIDFFSFLEMLFCQLNVWIASWSQARWILHMGFNMIRIHTQNIQVVFLSTFWIFQNMLYHLSSLKIAFADNLFHFFWLHKPIFIVTTWYSISCFFHESYSSFFILLEQCLAVCKQTSEVLWVDFSCSFQMNFSPFDITCLC